MSDLEDFVLNFCREMGGLVEPPAYGVYAALWPDELAARLGVEAYQKLAFDDLAGPIEAADITRLNYGHPLIERIITEVRRRPVWGHLSVPEVRLEKRGLAELAATTILLGNARLQAIPQTAEQITLNHYVRFNFKASLVTDEKQERLVTVLMHAQGGYAVPNQAELSRATPLIPAEPGPSSLPTAPLAWTPPPSPAAAAAGPLSLAVLTELLERAKTGAARELAGAVDNFRHRAQRHLELDQARLEQYYADLQTDLERRLNRAAEDRRPALADKLTAVQVERQNKLLDAQAKYELSLTLELINLAVISQPKITLPVQIENRHTSLTRSVTWDPLLHRLEPLVCDACGQPGYELFVCANGHLAHKACLAPQCVDCKRAYCQKCGDSVKSCVVCDRPVCVRSLNRCATCGRETCQEHIGLCHAAEGQPLRQVTPPPQLAPPPPPVEAAPAPAKTEKKTEKKATAKAKAKPAPKTGSTRRPAPPPKVTGQKIEVIIETLQPIVTAYVVAAGREVATRTWELTAEGLAVWCRCEKGARCPSFQVLKRPESVERIEAQLQAEINALRQEYEVASGRVSYYQILNNLPRPERRLLLRGPWKQTEALAAAQAAFDRGQLFRRR